MLSILIFTYWSCADYMKGWEPDWAIPKKLQFRKIDLNILRAYKNVINSKDIYTTAVKVCTCTHRSIKRIMNTNTAKITNRQKRQKH